MLRHRMSFCVHQWVFLGWNDVVHLLVCICKGQKTQSRLALVRGESHGCHTRESRVRQVFDPG